MFWHKFSSTQVLRTLSGTKLLLFRVWEEYRCKMATKSPRNRLLNRSSNSVSVNDLYSYSIRVWYLPHKDALLQMYDSHTRCLGACYMWRTCYRFTHRNLLSNHQSGQRVSTALHTVGSKIFLPFLWSRRVPKRDACFVVSQITISRKQPFNSSWTSLGGDTAYRRTDNLNVGLWRSRNVPRPILG